MANPKEKMRLTIELADNGIILRFPDGEFYTMVVEETVNSAGETDHTPEYQTLGRLIYNWLMDDVTDEYAHKLIIDRFDLDITATPKGSPMC